MAASEPVSDVQAVEIVARVCGDKRRHGPAEARRLAGRMRARGDRVSPYRCPFCGGWHVGHVPSMGSVARIAEVIRHRAYPPRKPLDFPT